MKLERAPRVRDSGTRWNAINCVVRIDNQVPKIPSHQPPSNEDLSIRNRQPHNNTVKLIASITQLVLVKQYTYMA